MIPFSMQDVVRATQGRLVGTKGGSIEFLGVSTDTRSIEKGSLFCALRGESYDGHKFVSEAFKRGALAALVDERAFSELDTLKLSTETHPLIVVEDVYRALGLIASFYREQFQLPVIGITGSSGKTTTKECVAAVLSFYKQVCVGRANLNNHIGLPLNLFNLASGDQCAVFEMGASASGEIGYLSLIAKPTIGVVTCVHAAHLKGFGSLDTIYRTKLELADFLGNSGGVLFVNGDDEVLVRMAFERTKKIKTFGQSSKCDYQVSGACQDGEFLKFTVNKQHSFRLKGYGIFNIMNAVAALAVADFLGYSLEELSAQWREFVSVNNRFQVEDWSSSKVRIVKDCYNANPQAFKVALQSFNNLQVSGKKIIVAGDMKELDREAENYHRILGAELAQCDADFIVLIGDFAGIVMQAIHERNYKIPTIQCANNQQVAEFLRSILTVGDAVFFKGSRSMRLEEAIDILRHELEVQPLV